MRFNATRPVVYDAPPCPDAEWAYVGNEDQYSNDRRLYNLIMPMKYADMEYAMSACNSDLVRTILLAAPIVGKHKRIVVDVKVHHLKTGEYSCMPGWHLDGSLNVRNEPKESELHHLLVIGPTARTEFLDDPVEFDLDPKWDFAARSKVLGKILDKMENLATFTVPNAQFVTYDDSFFHRAAAAKFDCWRLLVRVTETDIILPQNKIQIPYTHVIGSNS